MPANFELCIHQATSAASGFRTCLEGYSKAGIKNVEVTVPMLSAFVKTESVAAANRLIGDLGMTAVSSGGIPGLVEPNANRPEALDALKASLELMASLGVDRQVCPCVTTAKYEAADYRRGAQNLHEAGEIAKPFGITLMLEFMRGSTLVGTLPTALTLIRQAAHPNVKLLFDFYHFWAGLSKFEDIELLEAGELHHVHFQDVPDIPRELLDAKTREIPGDGISPLSKILDALKAKGYGGPLSVELFHPRFQEGDPYLIAKEIREKCENYLH